MADYLLVFRPATPLAPADCPDVPGPARVERFGEPVERIEVQIGSAETAERFAEVVREWLETAERVGMQTFDPQLGRTISRADLGEVLDCRARALAYALGVLGDTGVGAPIPEPPRMLPSWAWPVLAIALLLIALRFCSSLAA